MRIGIDFDNTIACYDGVFHQVAIERNWLPPADAHLSKNQVRDHLRAQDMEEEWIHLQGAVYGDAILHAKAYPGVKEFMRVCRDTGALVWIVSHKTRYPFRGPQHDLHTAARRWLHANGFFAADECGLQEDMVFLELTKEEKIKRIAALGCTHFVDDLPEFLREPGWPETVQRLLFDPGDHHAEVAEFPRFKSWAGLMQSLLEGEPAPRR